MRENIVTVSGLQYRRATWPRRIVARAIDVAILVSFCALFGGKFLPFTVPLSIVYLFTGNGLLAGRSIGKRLTGLKIIDARHGGPITPVQDFVRHRYLFFYNPIFLLLTAIDTSRGYFDKPETYVVAAKPLSPGEIEVLKEKPGKLDLEAMRKSLERPK
jgi:uncharacterized RDD family membrane protein YckC